MKEGKREGTDRDKTRRQKVQSVIFKQETLTRQYIRPLRVYKGGVSRCGHQSSMCDLVKFKHPFTCIVAGPTGSGKTNFCIKLLRNLITLCT